MFKIVTHHFEKILETEIHEKVLCHALEMFSLWSRNVYGELPKNIPDIFKKGLELKSASQSVRIGYFQWLLSCLEHGHLPSGIDLSASLIKTVEKAAQNPTQVPLMCEAVCAVCLILKTYKLDDERKNLQNFWNIVLDMGKQIFVSEKFCQSVPSETLYYVALMSQILLMQYSQKIRGLPDPLFRAIIYSVHVPIKRIRKYGLQLLTKLVHSSDGVTLAKNLLSELTKYIQMAKISFDDTPVIDDTSISYKAFSDTCFTLCSITGIQCADAQTIALNSLLCSHHPAIVSYKPNLWTEILQIINLDSKSFVSLNVKQIRTILIDEYRPIAMYENAIATLTKLCPEIILPLVIDDVVKHLSNSEMSNVTDEEYFIFLAPDDELYDKSVIPNSDDIYKDLSKKRENKVYSYKEQLEEIALRRELEEKKRQDGTWKPPQLTPKQQEVIKNQMEKEKIIRNRLRTLNDLVTRSVSLLNGARTGDPDQLSLYFSQLLFCILRILNSPLAATPLVNLYYNLRTTCFRQDLEYLGKEFAITTLRLYEPHCDLNEEWTKIDLLTQIQKTMEEFVTVQVSTVSNETNDDDLDTNDEIELSYLTAPAFAYATEFLKKAFLHRSLSSNEDFLLTGLQLISKQARVKGSTVNGELTDFYHPKYLPRYELMKLLLQLICVHSGSVQSQAVAALLDVAKSSSGEEYVATAEKQEIDCTLVALQNHLEVVRDVALRSLIIMQKALLPLQSDTEFNLNLTRRIWIAKHDISEENKRLADTLWKNIQLTIPNSLCDELLKDVIHPEPCIQRATASALVSLIQEDISLVQKILVRLLEIYNEKLIMIPAKLDQFEREIEPAIDQWEPRRGVAISLGQIASYFSTKEVERVMQFMVAKGLGDREEIVHKEMLAAALIIVEYHGKETISNLLPLFEKFLDKAPKSSLYDNVRQAVVILMGSLARHLEKDDERIQPIVNRLLAALSTPSQQVCR